jgi:4-amino-4-deoxy-L-arabinose transferase-like glycosyltransferase
MLLLALAAAIWFSNLEYRKLVRPDEGRYAEIPREMAASGDWLTPRLNGIKYFEKPPLQYWATAAAYAAFGEHHWTARLWPALTGLAGVLLTFFAGARLFGRSAGLYAALALGGSALYVIVAHIVTLDMGLTFFMTATLAGILLSQRNGASPRDTRVWMHVAWAAAAFAVLSKGLIGIVLPGAVVVLYALLNRDFPVLKRLHPAGGVALFAVICAPWFIAVSLANPEFPGFFFIHEHFNRFITTLHRRVAPWWSFLPILAVGILPWLVTMCDALLRAWRRHGAPGSFQPQRFLFLWAVFIFVFFSASSSKLPSYILPVYPALALLIGVRLAELPGRTLFWHLVPVVLLAGTGLSLAPQVVKFASDEVPLALYRNYVPWLAAAAAVALAGTAYALYASRRGRITAAVVSTALCGLVAAQLGLTGHDALSPASSAYYIAREIRPYLKPGVPFYSVRTYEQTLPFYIKRPVTLVAFADEMAYGLKQEPELWLPDMATFEREWRRAREALAIMDPRTYLELERAGLPMRVIARDTRRVVVRTADAASG